MIKKLISAPIVLIATIFIIPIAVYGADRVVVKNDSSTVTFNVADDGTVYAAGKVGIGTDAPVEQLHVQDGNLKVEQTSVGVAAKLVFATAAYYWRINQNPNTGRLTFSSPGGGATTAPFKFDRAAQENLFRVGVLAGDTVDINGKLVINGTDVTPPDYVFEPDYALETIEEHAELMWQNKHLPALPGGAAHEKEGVDVVKHQFGVLEELEKAHIYIDQLNTELKQVSQNNLYMAKTQVSLLQKVEELSQYILQQQEMIEQLKAVHNQEMVAPIKELEAGLSKIQGVVD